jgi:hypothetical protein
LFCQARAEASPVSLWPDPDKRKVIELYLENRKLAKQGRFTAKDRQLQWGILWVAVASLLVGIAGVIATIMER